MLRIRDSLPGRTPRCRCDLPDGSVLHVGRDRRSPRFALWPLAGVVAAALLLDPAGTAADEPEDWTYNLAFSGWVTSNVGNRYHTFTPESAERRAAEIAAAGFGAVITNGYHFRLNFTERDADIRRIARVIADACHRHGLKVIEHHDWTIHFYDGYPGVFRHPDWLQVDAVDMVTRHRIYCINNRDFQEAYLDYLRRWQRETDTDAYQLDEIQWLSERYCGCRWCRAKYERDTGAPFPPTHDPAFWKEGRRRDDYRRWMRWRIDCLAQFKRRIAEALRQIRPDVKQFTYTTTLQSNPGAFARGSSLEEKGRFDDTVGTEVNSVLFAAHPFVYATMKSRLAIGEAYGKPLVALNGQTPMTSYFVWAFGRTCRASLWYHLVEIEDGPPIEELLRWPYQMDDSRARSAADVAVLLSSSTRDLKDEPEYFYHEYEGWLQALCLSHNDVRVLLESQLDSVRLDPAELRLIVLPNVTAIRQEHASRLLDYVNEGGRLLLTFDAGTLDETGGLSPAPLADEAGVRRGDFVEDEFALSLGPAAPFDVTLCRVAVEPGTRVLATATGPSGEVPLLTGRKLGRGEIFHLAAKLGTLAFEDKQLPTSAYRWTFKPAEDSRAVDTIAAIVDETCGGRARFQVLGAPRGLLAPVYRTSYEGKACRAIHLLNASGRSLAAGDPVANARDEPLVMPPIGELTLKLPGRVRSAILATPEEPGHVDLAVRSDAETTVITIPAESFRTYALVYALD